MKKQKIAVLFGGASSEHNISCTSANFVLNNISKYKYEIIPVGISREGNWFLFKGDYSSLLDGSWINDQDNQQVYLSANRDIKGFLTKVNNEFEVINIDVVFPVLHGKNGEDGSLQGLLQLSNIPFVGCDMTSSAACMDKTISNIMFDYAGINQADFEWVYDYEIKANISQCIKKIEKALLTYPLFVKPSSAGSSVGVTKANNSEELSKALLVAAKEDSKILVEQAIEGKEVECAVLGNEQDIKVSTPGEIAPTAEFYDFDAKYNDDSSKLYIPARVDTSVIDEIKTTARKAYMLMGCAGLSRVDFFVDKNNNIYLNEINTLPGFTSISMYPKLFEYEGIKADQLIDELIKLALKR